MIKKVLLAISLFVSSITFAQKNKKPNVLFIFADDMTFEGLGSTSDGEVITPHLDKLKRQGVSFSHTFNQGGYNRAISVASRAMINTGRSLWTAMDVTNGVSGKSENEWPEGAERYFAKKPDERPKVWSEYMKDEGYDTYLSGKWHVDVPVTEAFDYARNVTGGMPYQAKDCYNRKFIEGIEEAWTPADTTYGGFWKGGKHWSEVLRDDALDYIKIAEKSDNPFFMYLGFNAPHDPRQAPQEYQDLYNEQDIKVPENFLPIYPYCEECGAERKLRDEMLAPFPRNYKSVKVNRKEYYALISHLDAQVGIILEKLKEAGLDENTYIIFTADHGLAVGDHGFMGKQNSYEASVRVPMLISGPGIKPGVEIDDLIYIQDAMATALEIAGSNAKVDFQSYLPLAMGKKMETRDAIINCYIGCQRMIRTEDYKMIIYPSANIVRLFNIKKDPKEMKDLAENIKYKPLMDEMFAKLQVLQAEIKDPLDVTPYYNAFMNDRF